MAPKAGSRHLRENGYLLICKYLLTLEPVEQRQLWTTSIFGWSFFVIMWNLMSRPESVESIQISHVTWRGDCLAIDENGGKGDRAGDNSYYKRVYSNPLKPEACPVLGLAMLIFAPEVDKSTLFAYLPERILNQDSLIYCPTLLTAN